MILGADEFFGGISDFPGIIARETGDIDGGLQRNLEGVPRYFQIVGVQ